MPFQILDSAGPRRNQLNQATSSLNALVGRTLEGYEKSEQRKNQSSALKALGLPEEAIQASIGNPKILEALVGGHIKNQSDMTKGLLEEKKKVSNLFEDDSNYEKVKDTFGQKFADLWRAAPTGGRTELLKHGIDAKMRGMDIEKTLSPIDSQKIQDHIQSQPEFKESPNNWPKFDKRPQGYTPKDWNEEKKGWRKENTSLFEENRTRLKNVKRDMLGVKNLNRLNETRKVGEGFEGTLINPSTGEFYGLAQLSGKISPESQEWVKEIARFQNRAKDAFGSRVTNFDLQSYMKQFPGLLNSYEGRKRILDMMRINYSLDSLYDSTLQKVYDNYGLNGIPPEEADKLTREIIKDNVEDLENEYLMLDQANQAEESSKQQDAIMSELPAANKHSGKKIIDEETGDVYQSDGKQWKKVS